MKPSEEMIEGRRRMVVGILNKEYHTEKIMFFIHSYFMPHVIDLLCGYTYESTPFVPPGVLKLTVTIRSGKGLTTINDIIQ